MTDRRRCLGASLAEHWWRHPELIRHEYEAHGTLAEAARAHNANVHTVQKWWSQLGLARLTPGTKPRAVVAATSTIDQHTDQAVLDTIRKQKWQGSVGDIADSLDISPRRVRESLDRLREAGYRVAADDGGILIEPVRLERNAAYTLDLLAGEDIRVGVVSDTHLGANEEALECLHLAYDHFQQEGITEVWHAGDIGTGVGMFRTHHAEAKVHTAPAQVDYIVDNYPHRPGITTRLISGNHDLEGDFGRLGFDACSAAAARRDDIVYLGEYGAYLHVGAGGNCRIHLLHGAGGMSYSFSYKAQKLVDGYPGGTKPNALIVGHWHVRGNIRARDVEVLWPGCFEWQSRFMQRLGLQPSVGFHILSLRVADDGSIVRWAPEWFPFYAGRTVAAA